MGEGHRQDPIQVFIGLVERFDAAAERIATALERIATALTAKGPGKIQVIFGAAQTQTEEKK